MKLFVYGTLLFPEIVNLLTSEKPEYSDSRLKDFKVVNLKNLPYPGLIKSPGDKAVGKVIDISDKAYKIISDWEDEEYTATEVVLTSGDKVVTFLHNKPEMWRKSTWDKNSFELNHLNAYLTKNIPSYIANNK